MMIRLLPTALFLFLLTGGCGDIAVDNTDGCKPTCVQNTPLGCDSDGNAIIGQECGSGTMCSSGVCLAGSPDSSDGSGSDGNGSDVGTDLKTTDSGPDSSSDGTSDATGDSGNDASCAPDCTGKLCGDDGCGGVCGLCPDNGSVCVAGSCECTPEASSTCENGGVYWFDSCGQPGKLIEPCLDGCDGDTCFGCTPDCDGKACGSNGCGGQCSPGCADGMECTADTFECACTAKATVSCDGSDMVWQDSCGAPGEVAQACVNGCDASGCLNCTPVCSGAECGDDGCGGSCGQCGNVTPVCSGTSCVQCVVDSDCGAGTVCIANVCGCDTTPKVYGTEGEYELTVVPGACSSAVIHVWGAGGGGAASGTGRGGGGAYVRGTLALTSAVALTITVGEFGQSGLDLSKGGTPGGGNGGTVLTFGGFTYDGGGGGGYSAVHTGGGATLLLIAGGGGGAGGIGGYNGGGAGGTAGANGANPYHGGQGGQVSSGGVGGTFGEAGFPGTALQGGNGGELSGTLGGGGGGGGWYGGGGGSASADFGGGGGGGSSHVVVGQVQNGTNVGASNWNAAASSNAQYAGSAGTGGEAEANGNSGRVVVVLQP